MRPQCHGWAYIRVSAKDHGTVQYKFQDVCLVYYLIYLIIYLMFTFYGF